jgi:hypothetical protein
MRQSPTENLSAFVAHLRKWPSHILANIGATELWLRPQSVAYGFGIEENGEAAAPHARAFAKSTLSHCALPAALLGSLSHYTVPFDLDLIGHPAPYIDQVVFPSALGDQQLV